MLNKIILLFTLSFLSIYGYSQDFLEIDSMNLIPLKAKKYYGYDFDTLYELDDNFQNNHNLNTQFDYDNLEMSNFGAEASPILYQSRYDFNINSKKYRITDYNYSERNIPFLQTNRPLSKIDFIFFGNRNEEFNGYLSQNLSRKINMGFGIRKSQNKGFFLGSKNFHDNLYLNAVFQNRRFRTAFQVTYNDVKMHTSSIIEDIYNPDFDPGRWSFANPAHNNTQNTTKNYSFSLKNLFSFGKSNYTDSTLFKPLKSVLDLENEIVYSSDRHIFSDTDYTNHLEDYGALVTNPKFNYFSKDLVYTIGTRNSININTKYLNIKLLNKIFFNDIIQSSRFDTNELKTQDLNIGFGADLKYKFQNATFKAFGHKSFSGYKRQDFVLNSSIDYKVSSHYFKGGVNINNQIPGYFFSNYYSSQSVQENSFNPTLTIEPYLQMSLLDDKFSFKAQYFKIDDFLILDSSLSFQQVENSFIQGRFQSKLHYKSLYFPTVVYYNNSLFERFFIKQTLAFRKKVFKKSLHLNIGADVLLNMNYRVPKYNPIFMMNVYESDMPTYDIFPNANLFATLEISKVDISFMYRNIMSSFMKSGTYYFQDYPIAPGTFFFRANWRFLD